MFFFATLKHKNFCGQHQPLDEWILVDYWYTLYQSDGTWYANTANHLLYQQHLHEELDIFHINVFFGEISEASTEAFIIVPTNGG